MERNLKVHAYLDHKRALIIFSLIAFCSTGVLGIGDEESIENSIEPASYKRNSQAVLKENTSKRGEIIGSSNTIESPVESTTPAESTEFHKVEPLRKEISSLEDTNTSVLKSMLLSSKEIDEKALVNQVLGIMQISKNNADVITQAFRFVRLDAHLSTLLGQLSQLRESHESLQKEAVTQQTKFNIVLDEIRTLAANVGKESVRLTEVEERLESEMEVLNDRIDSATEKIIQSSVSVNLLLDLSKETIQQTDKSVGISNEILMELKNVRTELGDVGQASVQTIYNVQKLEESLLMAMEDTGNKTIYALRQDQQLQYQLLPSTSPMKMDVDEVSLVPLGNGRLRNSMQADGTILPEPDSLPAGASSSGIGPSPAILSIAISAKTNDDEEEKRKQKAQHSNMQDTNGSENSSLHLRSNSSTPVKSNTERSTLQESFVSPCLSYHGKRISAERPRNCEDIQLTGNGSSGVYRIFPFESDPQHNGTEVYCDLMTEDGGWTVIQRRKEPLLIRQDFEKTWAEYESGFGILHDSHWLGLNVISELTKTGEFQLRIDMSDWEGESRVAEYGYFRVGNEADLYRLYVTDYSGTSGDSLAYHNGMAFTTKDRDNDLEKKTNCAKHYNGGWWYRNCHESNLNGLFLDEDKGKHDSYANGVNWYSWHGYYYSLKRTEMKIRSRHFGHANSM